MNFSSQALAKVIESVRIEKLSIKKLYNFTEMDLAIIFDALVSKSSSLSYFDLSYNHHLITLTSLERICHSFKINDLQLDVSNCDQLVRRDVEKLGKKYPAMRIIHNTVLYDYSVESIKSYLDLILAH